MAEDGSPYQVVPTSRVKNAIQSIAQKARDLGVLAPVKEQLLAITDKLLHQPEQWGDPLHLTIKPGGMVYRGFDSPFVVRYTVFTDEKIVFFWELRVIPEHPLA